MCGILARPEKEPLTELGRRIRAVRRAIGDPERKLFAQSIGFAVNTIASYEYGSAEPPTSVLAVYRDRFGVDVSWLVSGEGEMFVNSAKASTSSRAVDPAILKRLGKLVVKVHKAEGIKLPGEAILEEAGALYNDLVAKVTDWTDAAEIDLVIQQLERIMIRKLQSAAVEPGTGKRSA